LKLYIKFFNPPLRIFKRFHAFYPTRPIWKCVATCTSHLATCQPTLPSLAPTCSTRATCSGKTAFCGPRRRIDLIWVARRWTTIGNVLFFYRSFCVLNFVGHFECYIFVFHELNLLIIFIGNVMCCFLPEFFVRVTLNVIFWFCMIILFN